MEIFGGFMVMMSILGLFLTVIWLIMPFVVFAIKGKQDRSLEVLEAIDKRLAVMEQQLTSMRPLQMSPVMTAAEMTETATPAPDKTSRS